MILFWLAAFVLGEVGAFLWIFGDKVHWIEWVISTVIALLMAAIFQITATLGMTSDVETWSGYVTHAQQTSAWKEYYEEAIYRTETYLATEIDGDGDISLTTKTRSVFDHWEARERWHGTYYTAFTTLGDGHIDSETYAYIHQKFGEQCPIQGRRTSREHNSRMIDGDPNDYKLINQNRWIEPVVTTKKFTNRVKAAPSSFSFCKVPTNAPIFQWPANEFSFRSGRVMGEAEKTIDILKWDQMNALLGPSKKVNVIIIGFGDQDEEIADQQRAAWLGGKKNDLVICYGNLRLEDSATTTLKWAKVFGWTEKEDVKENLATLIKTHNVDNDIIPLIEKEIRQNYIIKDWKKFDNLTIEPPRWAYILYFSILVVFHGLFYVWSTINCLDKRWKKSYSYETWFDYFTRS